MYTESLIYKNKDPSFYLKKFFVFLIHPTSKVET